MLTSLFGSSEGFFGRFCCSHREKIEPTIDTPFHPPPKGVDSSPSSKGKGKSKDKGKGKGKGKGKDKSSVTWDTPSQGEVVNLGDENVDLSVLDNEEAPQPAPMSQRNSARSIPSQLHGFDARMDSGRRGSVGSDPSTDSDYDREFDALAEKVVEEVQKRKSGKGKGKAKGGAIKNGVSQALDTMNPSQPSQSQSAALQKSTTASEAAPAQSTSPATDPTHPLLQTSQSGGALQHGQSGASLVSLPHGQSAASLQSGFTEERGASKESAANLQHGRGSLDSTASVIRGTGDATENAEESRYQEAVHEKAKELRTKLAEENYSAAPVLPKKNRRSKKAQDPKNPKVDEFYQNLEEKLSRMSNGQAEKADFQPTIDAATAVKRGVYKYYRCKQEHADDLNIVLEERGKIGDRADALQTPRW